MKFYTYTNAVNGGVVEFGKPYLKQAIARDVGIHIFGLEEQVNYAKLQ